MMKTFWAEILRPGKWSGNKTVEFSSEDMENVVANFKALKGEVRPVLRLGGHPDHQSLNPAVGWVDDLRINEDGVVEALFTDVPDVVADAIEKRLYRTVSPGLWGNWEYEGNTYEWVLNHVAILGGSLPAISGLKDLLAYFTQEQAEALEAVGDVPELVFSFTESEKEGDPVSENTNNEALETANARIEELEGVVAELTAANEEITSERDTAVERVSELEATVAEFNAANDANEVEGLVDAAIADGRLLPKDKERMVALGLTMKNASINFSSEEEDAQSPFELFSEQLANGGKVVEFTEKAEAGKTDDRSEEEKDYEAGAAAAKKV